MSPNLKLNCCHKNTDNTQTNPSDTSLSCCPSLTGINGTPCFTISQSRTIVARKGWPIITSRMLSMWWQYFWIEVDSGIPAHLFESTANFWNFRQGTDIVFAGSFRPWFRPWRIYKWLLYQKQSWSSHHVPLLLSPGEHARQYGAETAKQTQNRRESKDEEENSSHDSLNRQCPPQQENSQDVRNWAGANFSSRVADVGMFAPCSRHQ